jgi:hypothetical protein
MEYKMQFNNSIENNENVYEANFENIYFPGGITKYPDFTQVPFIPNPYFMARTHYDEDYFEDPDAAIKESNTESEELRHKKSKEQHCEEHEKEYHKEDHNPQKLNYEIYAFEYESHPYKQSFENQNFNQMYNYNPYTTQNYMPCSTLNNMPYNAPNYMPSNTQNYMPYTTQNDMPCNYQNPMVKFDPFLRIFFY